MNKIKLLFLLVLTLLCISSNVNAMRTDPSPLVVGSCIELNGHFYLITDNSQYYANQPGATSYVSSNKIYIFDSVDNASYSWFHLGYFDVTHVDECTPPPPPCDPSMSGVEGIPIIVDAASWSICEAGTYVNSVTGEDYTMYRIFAFDDANNILWDSSVDDPANVYSDIPINDYDDIVNDILDDPNDEWSLHLTLGDPVCYDPCDPNSPDGVTNGHPMDQTPGGGGGGTTPDSDSPEDYDTITAPESCSVCDETKIIIADKSAGILTDILGQERFQSGELSKIVSNTKNADGTLTKILGVEKGIKDGIFTSGNRLGDIKGILDSDGDGKADDTTEDDTVESDDFDGDLTTPDKSNLTTELDTWWNTVTSSSVFGILNQVQTTITSSSAQYVVNYTLLGQSYSYTLDFSDYESHLDFMGSALLALCSITGVMFLFGGKDGF